MKRQAPVFLFVLISLAPGLAGESVALVSAASKAFATDGNAGAPQ
jgi:hypothetical protein